MKLLSKSLLIPLTAPLCHGKGTLLFLVWGISRVCVLIQYSKLLISSACFPCGQSLGLDPTFSSLFPASCAQGIPWKCFLSLTSLQAYTIYLGPLYSTFAAKDKTRNNIQQYSLLKKSLFLSVICACVLQIKFWDDGDG